ncbi:hypothetical protein BJX65DRAFT_315247 [Aspergillus insuetus]
MNDADAERLGELLTLTFGPSGGSKYTRAIVSAERDPGRPSITAIKSLHSSQGVSPRHQEKLALLDYLYDYSGGSLALVLYCISQPEMQDIRTAGSMLKKSELAESIASIHTTGNETFGFTETAWIQLRTNLFTAYPTAVLCGVLSSDIVPSPGACKDSLVSILHSAIKRYDFDISKQPVRMLLGDGMPSSQDENESDSKMHEKQGIFSAASTEERGQVIDFLCVLQRLQALVSYPDDIGALVKGGYRSADDIANLNQRAVSELMKNGLPHERAEKIYNHSVEVSVNREKLWTAAFKLRGTGTAKDVRLAAIDGPQVSPKTRVSSVLDTVSMGCGDCASITSPAAFFVDLLRTLNSLGVESRTLLHELLDRRPDLLKLQLSCANTDVVIPYIDLVNEVLEAVAWSLKGDGTVPQFPPFNMDDRDQGDSYLIQPRNVNYDVYEQLVEPLVFPLTVFPYNQATHSIRAHLAALGTTRLDVLTDFRAPYSISSDPDLLPLVQKALEHARSAECLGLQHEDYVAIVQEGFYPYETVCKLSTGDPPTLATYTEWIGQKVPSSTYWGYATPEDMLSEDGLTKIRAQLLPRSGLPFEGLLDILRSEYFNGQLIIEIEDPEPEHTPGELLNRMRLLEWDREQEQAVSLTVATCDRLQAFLRLKQSIQWPLEDLDPILTTLTKVAEGNVPVLVDMLAATRRLAEYGKLAPHRLQPLWSPFSTHHADSLYFRLFTMSALRAEEREAFTPDITGELPTGEKLSEHKSTILTALQISDADYLGMTQMLDMSDALTIDNLSQLYRVVTFCNILRIEPTELKQFLELYPEGSEPFKDPRTTLDLVQQFPKPLPSSNPWSLARLCFALKAIPNATDEACNPTIEKTVDIVHSLRAGVYGGVKDRIDVNLPASGLIDEVDVIITTLAGVREGGKILQFLDVTSTIDKEEFLSIVSPVLGMVALNGGQEVTPKKLYANIKGKKTVVERQIVFLEAVLPAFRLVDDTRCRQAVVDSLRAHFQEINTALLHFVLENVIYYEDDTKQVDGYISGMNALLQVVQSPEPTCGRGYFQPPAADRYVVEFHGAGQRGALKVDDIQLDFDDENRALTGTLTGGRFYRFEYTGTLSDLTWHPQTAMGASPAKFGQDVFVDDDILSASERVVSGLMRMSILVQMLELDVSEFEFSTVVRSATGKLDFNKLSLQDIRDLQQYHALRQDFSRKGADLSLLIFYKWIFSKHQSPDQLPQKLSQVGGWPVEVCRHFLEAAYAKCFQQGQVGDKLTKLFEDVGTLYSMWENFHFVEKKGLKSVPLKSLYGLASPVWKNIVATDFEHAATLRVSMQTSNRGPQVLTAANREIRDSQRNAVATYLLTLPYAEKHDLTDMDTLFEHFLIDVQMGPDLQTTRIKQATSSVQLFIHRCSLGLEDPEAQQLIKQSDLDFLLRYRLWEANRKAYLYPENWLEPTLRDTKSDQFQELESAMMQTKLDHRTINQLVRQYLYKIDDVSNLQTEAYVLYEGERADTLHIFGRTRTSPFFFYYRRATVSTVSYYTPTWTPWTKINIDIPVQQTDQHGTQLPKPRSYLIPVIYKGRLYLFLPEITVKQTPVLVKDFDAAQDTDFADMIPTAAWEIRMSYSEYRDGTWHPRCLARSVITRDVVSPSGTVEISDFKFWVDHEPRLSIRVECLAQGETAGEELGVFQLRDQQLILVDEESLPVSMISASSRQSPLSVPDKTIRTSFLKYWHKGGATVSNPEIEYGTGDEMRTVKIHLGYLDKLQRGYNYEWAIDYSSEIPGNTTALIVEELGSSSVKQYIDLGAVHEFGVSALENRLPPLLLEYINKFEEFPSINGFYETLGEEDYVEAFGQWQERYEPKRTHYHEGAAPSAIYNWELGVHIPCLILERLLATQQLELALKVARQMYDPRKTSPVNACWSFPPFQRIAEQPEETMPDPSTAEMTMDEWQESKANTHAAARANPRAYMTRIVMKYLEVLIALGDEHFRLDTLEAIPYAIQMYVEAAHIFGPQPIVIPSLAKRSSITYEDIAAALQGWNAEVEMELEFPYYIKPDKRGMPPPIALSRSTIRTGYFCVPGNPALASLRALIDDRLFKIRNGMDINGNKRTLPLYEAPIDPGALVRATGSGGGGIAGLLSDLESPMPKYRFNYWLSRASELVSEVRGFGSQLLSYKEAKDGERLATIQRQHRSSMVALTMRVKDHEKAEIEKAIEALQISRGKQEMRLKHLLALTGDNDKTIPGSREEWKDIKQSVEPPSKDDFRMSKYEAEEYKLLQSANDLSLSAALLKGTGAVVSALPQIGAKVQPMGAGVDTTYGGIQLGKAIQMSAEALRLQADQTEKEAERASRKGTAITNLQERRLEANTIGRELMEIDKEVEKLQASLETWEAAIQEQQQEIENAEAEEEWARSKYTSEQLYTLMESRVSTLFRQTFLMAVDMIKTVRRAMDFELCLRQPSQSSSIASIASSWETCRDGLLSGETLAIELQKLQTVYETTPRSDYEMYRTISLREIDPHAFLQLRETGHASFELKESLFDRDFPGHYCRRLMETKVYFPGLSGSISCTLTLVENKYRISATGSSYGEQKAEDFRTDKIPIQSIAATKTEAGGNGKLDPAFYYLNEYFPFEGAGAISKWAIELANELRQRDYSTISDIEIDITYSALAGGNRQAALTAAAQDLQTGSNVASIDLLSELEGDGEDEPARSTAASEILISGFPKLLPHITSRGTTAINSVELYLKARADIPEDLTARVNGKTLDPEDQLGDFIVRSLEDSFDITETWTVKLESGGSEWQEVLAEAWLLIGYSVTDLVKE